jgi:hypothetical protein
LASSQATVRSAIENAPADFRKPGFALSGKAQPISLRHIECVEGDFLALHGP